MREPILNALMHLFAIIASLNPADRTNRGKEIVRSYLYQQLNKKFAARFLTLFENFYDFYISEGQSLLNLNDIEKISLQINKGLSQREKIIVLVRLLEFSFIDEMISQKEEEFLQTVANTFNIDQKEFQHIFSFISDASYLQIDKDNLLIADQNEIPEEEEGTWFGWTKPETEKTTKHLFRENLSGKIVFLHIESINLFFFKCYETEGLTLKNQNINPGKVYSFDAGSLIKGQRVKTIYYVNVSSKFLNTEKKAKIVFSGSHVEFRFKGSKNGIYPFSFSEESGQLIGILGGSGVGKSTLLNLLNGKLSTKSGKLTINGFDLKKHKENIEGIIGFVPQDDLLFEELTVFQNLYYNARLCFGYLSKKQITQRVNKILSDLDLEDSKDLMVGNPLKKFISGGQRKRLNIALELIREPSLLFVDEPTSGLSSKDSEMVMHLLKEQALKGKLVIINIHQPSSEVFKLFDKLWVIDKGGRIIYQGNPIDAIEYFKTLSSHVNASESECSLCGNIDAEQILEIIEEKVLDEYGKHSAERKIPPEEWYKLYKQNIEEYLVPQTFEKKLPINYFRIPDFDRQFKIFSIRNVLAKLSNTQYLIINLLEAPLLAFILGYFSKYMVGSEYYFSDNKNLPSYLFMSVVVALFIGMIVSAEDLIKDQKIIERESFLNLSRFSYINSKIIFLFALSAIQTLMYVIVGNYILEIKGLFFNYWIVIFSTCCFANIVGLNISSALDSVVAVYIVIPFILVPQILLSGTVVQFDNLHPSLTRREFVPVVGDLMASRWAYEALAVEQFKNNRYEKIFYEYEREKSDANYKFSYLIPRLEQKLDENMKFLESKNKIEQTKHNFNQIKNGLKSLTLSANLGPYDGIEKLSDERFTRETYEDVSDYLQFLKLKFKKAADIASRQNDSLVDMQETLHGKQYLVKLKEDYYNKSLADYVLNRWELNKIYESPDKLIQKKDPGYMFPESNLGRAHFYSPIKIMLRQKYDTLWFNVSVLWIMTLILYLALIFNTFRKILSHFQTFIRYIFEWVDKWTAPKKK